MPTWDCASCFHAFKNRACVTNPLPVCHSTAPNRANQAKSESLSGWNSALPRRTVNRSAPTRRGNPWNRLCSRSMMVGSRAGTRRLASVGIAHRRLKLCLAFCLRLDVLSISGQHFVGDRLAGVGGEDALLGQFLALLVSAPLLFHGQVFVGQVPRNKDHFAVARWWAVRPVSKQPRGMLVNLRFTVDVAEVEVDNAVAVEKLKAELRPRVPTAGLRDRRQCPPPILETPQPLPLYRRPSAGRPRDDRQGPGRPSPRHCSVGIRSSSGLRANIRVQPVTSRGGIK